jgi:cytoskeletal protein RodZ
MSELKRRLFKVVGDGGQSERQKRVEPIEEVREGIAQLLKQTRERYGQSLRDVSASLRIRLAYLQAIETGRFRELPGTTYAVGFVRSYAEYLGLDANEIVRRFKGEVEGLDNRTHLAFPEPVPEGKVPGGAIIILSLVVLAIGYGGWYAINRDADGVGLIPRVSESLKGLVGKSDQKSETAAAPSATSSQSASSEPAKSSSQTDSVSTPATTPVSQAPTAPSAVPNAPSPASGEDTNGPSGLTATPAAAPAVGGQAPAAAPANSAPEEVVVGSTEEDDTTGSAVPAAPSAGDGTSLPAAPSVPDTAATAPAAPQATGSTTGESRLQLRARLASWVQIRDASGAPILTRTLAAGERVPVPDQPGLTLFTGNAGGVEILLDGRALPALGPVGAVRRNIPLDLKALQQGRAGE